MYKESDIKGSSVEPNAVATGKEKSEIFSAEKSHPYLIKEGQKIYPREGSFSAAHTNYCVATAIGMDGERYIKISSIDGEEGCFHWIPLNWIEEIDGANILICKTADQFHAERFNGYPGDPHSIHRSR